MRSQLVDLQKLYDEKQAKLSKIKSSSPKKSIGSAKSTPAKASRAAAAAAAAAVDSGDSCLRGPGRPKKRTLKSTRRRMGRPPKKIVKEEEVEEQVSTVKEEKCPTPMDGLAAALKSSQGIHLPDMYRQFT